MFSRILYSALSLLTIALTVYSYNNHKTYFNESLHFFRWFIVYLIPFILIFGFFLVGTIKKQFPRIYSLVILGSILLPCYLIEYQLVKKFYDTGEWDQREYIIKAAKENNIKADLRLRREVVRELNENGTESYPWFKVRTDNEIYPIGSIPKKTIVLCNELGVQTVYKSDRHGFNNPDYVWEKNTVDILFLGDSFTQGSCVLDNKSFVNLLRNKKLNIINLGNGSNHPYTLLIGLIEYAVPTKPKKIIWMHCSANDIPGMVEDTGDELFYKYVNEDFSQNLIGRSSLVEKVMLSRYNNRFVNHQKIHWPSFFKLSQLRTKLNLSVDSESNITKSDIIKFEPIFEKIVKKSKNLSDSINSEIYFVHIPTYKELIEGKSEESKIVEKIIVENNIKYFDLTDFLLKNTKPKKIFSWETTGHFSTLGTKLTSKFIKENIID